MENNENTPYQSYEEENPKKISPFDDSPYVMNEPQTQIPQEAPEAEVAAPVAPASRKKSGGKVWKGLVASVLVVALVAVGCGITAFSVESYWAKNNKITHQLIGELQQQIEDLKQEVEDNSYTGNGNSISGTANAANGLTPGQVYAQNKKSVVAISNQTQTNIFGQVTETASSGSGFIISADGYVVTNYHVVENASKLTVITSDSTEYSATLIGFEESNDIALLKIEATDLPAVKLGNSDDLIVGDQVVAIGNPLGELTNSLTVGFVSAKDRDVNTDGSIINMLQTDAAINPGNSGGPLFNMKGEVIGITTAKYSGTTASGASIEGIGFAIPMTDVAEMFTELMENGFISTPYLGVTVTTKADGIGVYVSSVDPNTPASKAGLKAGDIIVALGEYETKSLAEMDKVLRNFEPNDTTFIYVYRNRQVLELTITFGQKNQASTAKPANSIT